ncbi:polysaccharide lyase 6 family protein [uncultured Draconibacterium sp.]|uniref:polysaccharide lyase 6 family protein n=1 Tax=uncultured Draconibacterium sp. TaxID=1573823 RepID=UPI0029C89636|nr:polysaccharide lyase 6 family protein [uncultured Draconibacterium sp.]
MKLVRYILIILIMLRVAIPANAEVYRVSTKNQFDDAVASVLPGDTVLLAAQQWDDVELEFKGEGSENAPIVFGAETLGQTIFTGNSRIEISGNWLEVRDFIFRDGDIIESGSIIAFRNASSSLAHNCRLTNVTVENYNPANGSIDTKYVSLYGTYNRVDHCSFSGKTNSGATFVVWLDETPDYHLIDHNYFGSRQDLGENGGETIRIGTSDWERYNSNCVVEYNLFDECDGEIEIISNKSVGNHYRYNTFDNCEGTLTLRHGSDCWVYGNFFFGDEEKDCGGIRLIGPGHRVYNNYLENLEGTSYRAAICLVNGVPDSPANRYRQVEDARVGFNTIVNCKEPFAIGAGVDEEKSLAPITSFIENNLIVSKAGRDLVKVYSTADGVDWKGNYTDAETIGVSADGFIQTELPMVLDGKMNRPSSENPVIGAAVSGVFDTISVDIDGQTRPETAKDVGCDQLSNEEIMIFPVTKSDVGANYDLPTYLSIIEKPNYKISVTQGALNVNFENEGKRIISLYSVSGKLLSTSQVYAQTFNQMVSQFPHFLIVEIREPGSKYAVKLIQ